MGVIYELLLLDYCLQRQKIDRLCQLDVLPLRRQNYDWRFALPHSTSLQINE